MAEYIRFKPDDSGEGRGDDGLPGAAPGGLVAEGVRVPCERVAESAASSTPMQPGGHVEHVRSNPASVDPEAGIAHQAHSLNAQLVQSADEPDHREDRGQRRLQRDPVEDKKAICEPDGRDQGDPTAVEPCRPGRTAPRSAHRRGHRQHPGCGSSSRFSRPVRSASVMTLTVSADQPATRRSRVIDDKLADVYVKQQLNTDLPDARPARTRAKKSK